MKTKKSPVGSACHHEDPHPAWQIGFRVLIAVGALLVTAIIVYLERDCYDDNGVLGDITFIDALYYATVSLSTTGYGDIAPVCESARLVNVLVITPLRFIFLIVLIGTTVEALTKRTGGIPPQTPGGAR